MGRRRFDFFYIELCCALGHRISRYSLWLALHEHGFDAERLGRSALMHFFDAHLDVFLATAACVIEPHTRRKLRRKITRYDPEIATPYEIMERLTAPLGT